MEKGKKKTIQEIAIESQLIITRFEEAEVNQIVTYQEISKLTGRDVQKGGRGNLETAKRYMLREYGKIFDTVRNVGVMLVDAERGVNGAHVGFERIKRTAKRTAKRLVAIDYYSLSREKQVELNMMRSTVVILENIRKKKPQEMLKNAVEKNNGVLPFQKTLEVFRENGNK